MPPKAKARNAPNQHDKRHESGLAAPGKRVSKQRSNGQLNGALPNGKPSPSHSASSSPLPPPPLPSTGLNQGFRFSQSSSDPSSLVGGAGAAGHTDTASSPPAGDHAGTPEATAAVVASRGRVPSDISLDEAGPRGGDMAGDGGAHAHDSFFPIVNVDAHAAPNKMGSGSSSNNNVSAVSTILTNYPLRDAISILILLLSLPPTLVLVIQTLFASLTFVPPTAGLSISTLPNIKDMFNSGGLGYPALATILTIDLVFFLSWSSFWNPLQEVLLDLSQAVIAVSLSGAASTNGRPTYSIVTTSFIVCMVHVLRYKAIHLTALDYLRSVINKAGVGVGLGPVDFSFLATNYFLSPPSERGYLHAVIRTILGIHIVSQGVTTCIRRSLVKANEQSSNAAANNVPAITKTDADTAGGGAGSSDSRASASLEAGQHSTPTPGSEARIPSSGSSGPHHRDGTKPRDSSTKKKRKQANQVRSQQPLWAAIASTKVTFIKEMEQRDAADDAREAANMHFATNNHNSNNSNDSSLTTTSATTTTTTTNSNTDRLWICEVRDTEIFFNVELSSHSSIGEKSGDVEEGSSTVGPGIDKSKPFYVCINGAAWSSTKISPISDGSSSSSSSEAGGGSGGSSGGGRKIERYEGEIFGLAPLSSYLCEIVSIANKTALCEASVITQPAVYTEQATSSSSSSAQQPPAPQTLRPSSPITTLKQSIQSAEAKLNETRNRGRKSKKDQRAIHSDIKREIQALRSKLDTSGGADDKQERRLMQITQHKNQAEEAAAELKEQIDALGDIPATEVAESDTQRRKWQSALDAKSSAQRDLDAAKTDSERELAALRTEILQAESKHEKLLARHAQRSQDMEKLVTKQHAELSAKQKRDLERAQTQQIRDAEQQQFRFLIANYEAEASASQQKAQECYQQIAQLQSWPTSGGHHQGQGQQQQPPPYPGYSNPPTPDNNNGNGGNGNANQPSNSATCTPAQVNGYPAFIPQQQQHQQQGSFGTNVSPFSAAAAIVGPPPPPPPRQRSSSMLSQYSGFTDDDGEAEETLTGNSSTANNVNAHANISTNIGAIGPGLPPPPPFPLPTASPFYPSSSGAGFNNPYSGTYNSSYNTNNAALMNNNHSSEGSGSLSGSTGSNSPRPDAKVFVPGGVGVIGAGAGAGVAGTRGGGGDKGVVQSSPLQSEAIAATASTPDVGEGEGKAARGR